MKDILQHQKFEAIGATTLSANTSTSNSAPTFSARSGKIETPTGDYLGEGGATCVTALANGKILVGGYAANVDSDDLVLLRYNSDGSLDSSFGVGGEVITDINSNSDDFASSITVLEDGKILVGGISENGNLYNFTLVRYNSNGSLDTSFGTNGIVTENVGSQDIGSYPIVKIDADGKILFGGTRSYAQNLPNQSDFVLFRYETNGARDVSFGEGGMVTTNIGEQDIMGDIVVLANKRIVVAGGTNNDFALIRYNSNGTLDDTFGNNGQVTTDIEGSLDFAVGAIVQADGKILLGGFAEGCGSNFAFVRYTDTGSVDTSFGDFGVSTEEIPISELSKITQQTDGKILVSGNVFGLCQADFSLTRFNASGSLDTDFGNGGVIATDFESSEIGLATALAVQADGKILQVGVTYDFDNPNNSSSSSFAIVRYDSDGSLDTTFGEGNSTLNGSPTWYGEDAVVLDNDAIIGDAELSAADNFAGSTLTLERQGGANANDVFSAIGLPVFSNAGVLSLVDSKVIVGETEIGTYTQSGGRLKISFNVNATQELVNQTVQQIAYDNNSPVANGTANISWTFNDGSGASNAWVRGNTEVELSPEYSDGVVIDGKANVGQTLTAYNNIQSLDNVEPFGVDAPVLSYQWQANGINIRGATSSTYKLTTADFGKKIKVVVTEVGNNIPLQKFTSAETVAVGNINKVGTGTVTIAGTPTQGETLTASSLLTDLDNGGTPNNVSADVVFYQWKANGVIIAESSAASNDASLTLTQAQVGKRISVDAVYVDNLGNREVVSSRTTAVVANVNDAPTGGINFNKDSDVPYVGQTLSFTNDIVDLDGLPTTIRYQWTADGVAIRGAISTKYVVRESDLGKKIQVVATYTDLFGTAERVVSIETAKVVNELEIAPVSPPPMAFNGANALLLVDQILNASEAPQALVFDSANYQSYGETEMIGIKPWEFNIV